MRRISSAIFLLTATAATLAAGLLSSSCAKAEPEDGELLEKEAFDAWIQKYVIDRGIDAVEQSNGMYVEFLEDGDQTIDSSRDTVVWLRLDYTATDIQDNVFVTRDSTEALHQRTFTPYTYYAPDYIFCSSEVYGMSEGRHFALVNDLVKPDGSTMKMSEGSRVRLYVPSYLAYGTEGFSDDQGYGGQYTLGSTKIIIEDLVVKEIVKDPMKREEGLVAERARRWGLAETDTIAEHFYVDTVGFTPRADLLDRFPDKPFVKEYALTADSTANVWFVGKFLDGFVFDSNIDTVYDEFYNRRAGENYPAYEKTFAALSLTPGDEDDQENYIAAFIKAIPDLRRGQWSRVVLTSAYGYGATGLSKALQDQAEYYANYADTYNYYNMYNNYGNSYYDNYYNNPYMFGGGMGGYLGYSTSGYSEDEDERTITTEIQSYTPLVFEIYIETEDEE